MTPGPWVLGLAGGSTLLFGAASLGAFRRLADEKAGHTRFLLVTGGIGLLLNVVVLRLRAMQTSAPVAISTSFDMTILMSSLVVVTALAALAAKDRLRGLEGMLLPIACLTQVAAWLKVGKAGTEANYQSWFEVHPAAFALGALCFVLSGVAGIAYLAITRVLRRKQPSPLLGKFAPLESLERFGRWALLAGWPVFTFGILTGICEVVQSGHPRRWLTDPLVVFTFAMWALYAVVLMQTWFRPSFRGRRSARWSAVSMALLGFTFLVVDLISPIHR
jgi:ABC-type uncharacterized transport system permease subunit